MKHTRFILMLVLCASSTTQLFGAVPRKDTSLPWKEYVAKGMPAPDVVWTEQEYKKAAELLESIARENPAQLPRIGSLKSGVMFARMISPENLKPMSDQALTPRQRVVNGAALFYFSKFLELYRSAQGKWERNYQRELAALSDFELDGASRVMRSMEVVGMDPAVDSAMRSNLSVQMDRLKHHVPQLLEAEIGIATTSDYESTARDMIISSLRERMPDLSTFIDKDQRTQLAKLLTDAMPEENDAKLKDKMLEVARLLDKTAKAPEISPRKIDRSLTVEEYRAKGMPSLDVQWGPAELLKAVDVLQRQYPRYGSPKSGALFAKMTSMDEMLAQPKEADIRQRAERVNGLTKFEYVIDRYFSADYQKVDYQREFFALVGTQIRLDRAIFDYMIAAEQAMPDSPQKSQWIVTNHQNCAQFIMRELKESMVLISKNPRPPVSMRRAMLDDVTQQMTPTLVFLKAEQKTEAIKWVQQAAEQEPDQAIRSDLEKFGQLLK